MKGFAIFVWVGFAGVASIALFHITFEVERLQDELSQRLLPHLLAPAANQVGDIEQFQSVVSPVVTRGP